MASRLAMVGAVEVADGPVLSLISKRLWVLRKKHNRILQMEESLAQGKPLNKEQEELLRSKLAISLYRSFNPTLSIPATTDSVVLHVLLRFESDLGDSNVGEVYIPLKDLLNEGDSSGHFVSYQVCKPSSDKPKGILNLSYKIDWALDLKDDMTAKGSCAPDPIIYNFLMADSVKSDEPDRVLPSPLPAGRRCLNIALSTP